MLCLSPWCLSAALWALPAGAPRSDLRPWPEKPGRKGKYSSLRISNPHENKIALWILTGRVGVSPSSYINFHTCDHTCNFQFASQQCENTRAHFTVWSPYDMKTRLCTWSERAAPHIDTKSLLSLFSKPKSLHTESKNKTVLLWCLHTNYTDFFIFYRTGCPRTEITLFVLCTANKNI